MVFTRNNASPVGNFLKGVAFMVLDRQFYWKKGNYSCLLQHLSYHLALPICKKSALNSNHLIGLKKKTLESRYLLNYIPSMYSSKKTPETPCS